LHFFLSLSLLFVPALFLAGGTAAGQNSPFGSEMMRTLVGSLGLIAAVPLTTAIAAGFALYSPRPGKWGQFLGPVGSEEGHRH
jgi:uncharacterized membrane protein